jgi:hypothetical protein
MLAWFVNQNIMANSLTPDAILILFIVSVLGAAWAVYTLFTYHRSRSNGVFVAFIDLCFCGAFIGAVYVLRGANQDCTNVTYNSTGTLSFGIFGTLSYSGPSLDTNKPCAMLKASWIFGIMNCIFFFFTACLALLVSRGHTHSDQKVVYRETHVSRHGHRRSGSHRSHRSSHSGRRHAYV